MAKKPNVANITYAFAQLGGGSKKEGGGVPHKQKTIQDFVPFIEKDIR